MGFEAFRVELRGGQANPDEAAEAIRKLPGIKPYLDSVPMEGSRAEWIVAFRDEPLAATANEAYQRIILPQCQPGVEQPT